MGGGQRWGRCRRQRLGRRFGWLWAAYGTSAFGTWLAFGAFDLIAIMVLHAGPARVAALSCVGAAVGAVVAVPLGPWVEFRRRQPMLVVLDAVRCAALLTVPAAYLCGVLTFTQLLAVSVVVAAADILFRAVSGAYLKTLLAAEDLLVANARFESTTWTVTVLGPPLGGVVTGLFGPVVTVGVNAASFLLSALGVRAARGPEPSPAGRDAARLHAGDLGDGWRFLRGDATLRPLLVNTVWFNGLLMATSPLLAVLMLGELGFAPWQYGLVFAVPALGGLAGSRLAGPLVARFGVYRVLWVAGAGRAVWPIGLVGVGPGSGGLALVAGVELGLIFCCAVFSPVCATYRLRRVPAGRVVRVLTAWTVTTRATTAALTAVWGVLGGVFGVRAALGLAGALVLATPLLLPRRAAAVSPSPRAVAAPRSPWATA